MSNVLLILPEHSNICTLCVAVVIGHFATTMFVRFMQISLSIFFKKSFLHLIAILSSEITNQNYANFLITIIEKLIDKIAVMFAIYICQQYRTKILLFDLKCKGKLFSLHS